MQRAPDETRTQIDGLLAFVHTPFAIDGGVDLPRFQQHLWSLDDGSPDSPSAYFVCCGTGEFWSLDLAEYESLVEAAVSAVGARTPVIAGVGYGTSLALQFVAAAERGGADGLLVFPPYLASGPQEGLYRHYGRVAGATELAVTVYHRDNAVFEPQTVERLVENQPNVVGLKDGFGDLDFLAEMRRRLGDGFLLMNGMPSAEMYAKCYAHAGIRPYSPGGIEFVPEIAWAFDHAIDCGDWDTVDRWVEAFYRPYTELRNQVPGYGIALVKAALRIRGRSSGGVRAPLVDPTPEHEGQLATLIERGLAMVAECS